MMDLMKIPSPMERVVLDGVGMVAPTVIGGLTGTGGLKLMYLLVIIVIMNFSYNLHLIQATEFRGMIELPGMMFPVLLVLFQIPYYLNIGFTVVMLSSP